MGTKTTEPQEHSQESHTEAVKDKVLTTLVKALQEYRRQLLTEEEFSRQCAFQINLYDVYTETTKAIVDNMEQRDNVLKHLHILHRDVNETVIGEECPNCEACSWTRWRRIWICDGCGAVWDDEGRSQP
jgi:hypothetical protein